ncbi:MAG: hypothetical protein LBJ71_02615 [Holosporaceae bacterium]|jgi:hypothetical protein|nr:hypothetical protein [Holosporaceae bacterium]
MNITNMKIASLMVGFCCLTAVCNASISVKGTIPAIDCNATEDQIDRFIERLNELSEENGGVIDIVIGDMGGKYAEASKCIIYVDPRIPAESTDPLLLEKDNKMLPPDVQLDRLMEGLPVQERTKHSLYIGAHLSDFLRFVKENKKLYDLSQGTHRNNT